MPLPPTDQRPFWALGARRAVEGRPDRAEIIARLREQAKVSTGLFALLDARGVAGERHLLSAWAHLGRARERGESRLRDRNAEFVLFVAGDDQLPRALGKVGVVDDTETFVVVAERSEAPGPLLERFGLVEDPSVYPKAPDEPLLERLGIGADDRSSVPPSDWEGLVLERVALLELSAPHGPPTGGPSHSRPPSRPRPPKEKN